MQPVRCKVIEAYWGKQNELKQEEKQTIEVREMLMQTISSTFSAEDTKYSRCSIKEDEEQNV